MKVANEMSYSSSLSNLSQTKVFALLTVPQEEREAFIEENPVEDMTTLLPIKYLLWLSVKHSTPLIVIYTYLA